MSTSGLPIFSIDATGASAPSFADTLAAWNTKLQGIFGADIYIAPDSQDGQLVGVWSAVMTDINAAVVGQVYQAFSPATAKGNGLSSVVKINGIAREVPSFASVDLVIVGVAGTIINNGVVRDAANNKWSLPDEVTIPFTGTITVTALCQALGAIVAPANTVNQIATPTLGWQSATNPAQDTPGAPVEQDAVLRQRQTVSTAIPSLSIMDGIIGAIASLPGVERYRGYDNDTAATDANGIPSHSISMVVEGGDAVAIATAILTKKSPGTGTYGTTSETLTTVYGYLQTIHFYRPTIVAVVVEVTLTALPGYLSSIGVEIQNAVASYISALGIGQKVMLTRVYVPANLYGSADGQTYEVTAITLNGSAADVAIAFNAAAMCAPSDVTITV